MDANSKKILKFIIKHKNENISIFELSEKFSNLPKEYIIEIVNYLYQNKYIRYIGLNAYIQVTNKGETIFKFINNQWVSEHFIETLSFVIALIALIFSIIALFFN